MSVIGTVESLWRYPVKSMRGEELESLFVSFGGVRGDRRFAFRSSASPAEFPYFTARDQRKMLRYTPRLQSADRENPQPTIEVETPTGERLAIDNPALITQLRRGLEDKHDLTLMRSDRSFTDSQPISIISLQTVKQLGAEAGATWDKRRFRANVYLDLARNDGFGEDQLVGRSIRIGDTVVVSVVARDVRCMMITLDPDTAARAPALLKTVAQAHSGTAGVYGSVVVEGTVRKGDAVEILA